MNKLKDVLIVIGVILTLPFWIICIIIILFSIPKDLYSKIDEHREAME